MPKKISGKWKCKNCGFEASGKTWNDKLLREKNGILSNRAWYACPSCNQEVELTRA